MIVEIRDFLIEALINPLVLFAFLFPAYCFLFVVKEGPLCLEAKRRYESDKEFCLSVGYSNDQPICQRLSDLHKDTKLYCEKSNFEKGMNKLFGHNKWERGRLRS